MVWHSFHNIVDLVGFRKTKMEVFIVLVINICVYLHSIQNLKFSSWQCSVYSNTQQCKILEQIVQKWLQWRLMFGTILMKLNEFERLRKCFYTFTIFFVSGANTKTVDLLGKNAKKSRIIFYWLLYFSFIFQITSNI